MQLPQLRYLRPVPHLVKISKHSIQLRQHPLDEASDELERQRHIEADAVAEDLVGLFERELVAGEVEFSVAVGRVVGVKDALEGEEADIAAGDEGHGFARAEGDLPPCGKVLADEVVGDVVHEGDGAEDRVRHCSCRSTLVDQVILNFVFGFKVRHVRGGFKRFVAGAVAGCVYEVGDVVLDGLVDHSLPLSDFSLCCPSVRNGYQNGEDSVDRSVVCGF